MKKHTTSRPSHHAAKTTHPVKPAQALRAATTNGAGKKMALTGERLMKAVQVGKKALVKVQTKAVSTAKTTDRVIRANPYRSAAVALGVGAVVGYLASRRRTPKTETV